MHKYKNTHHIIIFLLFVLVVFNISSANSSELLIAANETNDLNSAQDDAGNITTKIYRSTDKFDDLHSKNASVDNPDFGEHILKKEVLLMETNNLEGAAESESASSQRVYVDSSMKFIPWIVFSSLVLLLTIMFLLLKRFKI